MYTHQGTSADSLDWLWITLCTKGWPFGGTDSEVQLEFLTSGKEVVLPVLDGNDLENAASATYLVDVENLWLADFWEGRPALRCVGTEGNYPEWHCGSILIVGISHAGVPHPLVLMTDVDCQLRPNSPSAALLPLETICSARHPASPEAPL